MSEHFWGRIFSLFFFRILKKVLLYILFLPVSTIALFSQNYKITGTVYDKATSKPLNYVTVHDITTSRGTFTGDSGYFNISLIQGQHTLEFSYTGYEQVDTIILLNEDLKFQILMSPQPVSMEEVIISANRSRDHVASNQMSTFSLSNTEMKKLPSISGETDPLKLLQLTPGVQAGSEGNIGFYVRGGGTDQNLILYDNTLLYNPGHLIGFLSVFNPDLIKDITIIKSGIPSQYGGKLSSVIFLNSYKGNKDSLEVMGNLGIIASRISIGAPLFKKKGSFIFGARRTYLDLYIEPIVRNLVHSKAFPQRKSQYNFFDLNAGFDLNISSHDLLSFSGYFGRDNFSMSRSLIEQENSLNWGNTLAALSWNHVINNKSTLNTTISRTLYQFNLNGSQSDYYFGLFSSVEDYNIKSDISLNPDRHAIKTGFEMTSHGFVPNRINAQTGNYIINFGQFSSIRAFEGGIFLDDEFEVSQRITLSGGFRYSFFDHHGPYKKFSRNSLGQITDTIFYPKGKSLAFYNNLEPRLVLKYQLTGKASIKASYMRIAQYIHLATSSSASLPTDVWIPSTTDIKPQIGDQVSIGYFRNFPAKSLEFTSEIYFKRMNNQLNFLRGIINSSIDGNLEKNITIGYGQSYGVELYLHKFSGNTTGWLSYTLSRTEQKFEVINEGYFYPAKYDRRHQVSLTVIQKFNNKWSGSVVFVFVSGNAFTMPVGRYIIQGNIVNEYGDVNSFRMPPYHRMDISMNRKILTGKGWSSELNFSIYNLYCRANPYFIYFATTGNIDNYSLDVKAVQVSLFPIIPSVSWSFKF
jgi:hypothetical protein